MLFNEYPDNFFSLLYCRYQQLYADMLLNIYSLFYGAEALAQPTREEVRSLITLSLERRGITEWAEELQGSGTEMDELQMDEASYRAHLIYRRLLACGWLEEERDDDFNDIVSMPFYAASVLGVLRDASIGRKVSYAGYVGNVYLQLSHLRNNPGEASFLKEARRNSEELQKKLQELYNSVKTFIRQTKDKDGVASVLEHFFGSYVEKFFSAAYGRVKTVDNPFKYRHRINEMLLELRQNKDLLARIAESYEGVGDRTSEVIEDLDAIHSVFSGMDEQIMAIDIKKEQYERIVKEQVRYFETGHGDMKSSLASVLREASHSPDLAGAFFPKLKDVSFLDAESLSSPRNMRRNIKPETVVNSELSDEDYNIERLRACRRIAASVGRRDVLDFINLMLKDAPEILASQMAADTIKDLTCLLLSKYVADEEESLHMADLGRTAENRYLSFEEFRLQKRRL